MKQFDMGDTCFSIECFCI